MENIKTDHNLIRSIYLDYNATTPHDPEVINAMQPYLGEHFGNPSSSVEHEGVTVFNHPSPRHIFRPPFRPSKTGGHFLVTRSRPV